MKNLAPNSLLSRLFKVAGSALIVLVPMSISFWPAGEALSVSGGPTGWCTDASGRNFRCGSGGGGGGGSGGGGAGCATMYENSDAAISKSNSSNLVYAGNQAWDRGDMANAADLYQSAIIENPANSTARGNLSGALNKLGVARYNSRGYTSAWLFFDRAVRDAKAKNRPVMEKNRKAARSRMPTSLNCATCGKAIISDIGYGLDNSASFLSYANQASANFKNCKQRISKSCSGTDGQWLSQQIRNCSINIRSIPGIKSCIREAWNSVN